MSLAEDRSAVAVTRIGRRGQHPNGTGLAGLTASPARTHFAAYLSGEERATLARRAIDVLAAVNAADRAAGVAPRKTSNRAVGNHAWLRRMAATSEEGGGCA